MSRLENTVQHLDVPQKYLYRAFGLVFISDFVIPELMAVVDQKADVTIALAPLSSGLHDGDDKEYHYFARHNYFYLQIKNVAKYLVRDGRHITIDPLPGAANEQVRIFLLGTSLGVLLHQRDILPLHGSAVATMKGCALFLGESGVGKSTIAAALSYHGLRIVTDDICAISFKNSKNIEVHSSYPQLKLCQDSTKYLQIPPETLTQVPLDFEKFSVQTCRNFFQTSLRLSHIFILDSHNNPDINIEPITGVQKFIEITNNIYRGSLVEKLHLTEQQFSNCAKLCNNISNVFKVLRPKNIFLLDELTKRLLQYF